MIVKGVSIKMTTFAITKAKFTKSAEELVFINITFFRSFFFA